ncbi:M20/M25/M40 family metallo-hydrolase [Mammaliicoccus lentus]|uniref:M20/M25/M40 family metallo-hydrolase n=1 Tax=Mammaliicoccus lentus TaxID=42858 RepID=UPI002DB6CE60|nr:M20/M25/M40 family metallo-hydrolase [Mammaliicoccus lentus]MEB8093186.1 M20/M25/M40 family metallo-hydrolase [Mammaliicoccus lentus]
MNLLWQTSKEREKLLKKLVSHASITHSEGEKTFPYFLMNEYLKLDYFKSREDQIILQPTGDGRNAVLAYYKAPNSKKTLICISHYDTVGIDDFSEYKMHAFEMDKLTEIFKENDKYLSEDAKEDIKTGDYLFGRGSMDMKPGLMIHMSTLEKAIYESWDINIIVVSVPDEEVGSLGILKAVEKLNQLRKEDQLEFELHLNSEPTFSQAEKDSNHYIYSGTIGKIMPSVLCYGKETHVGQPTQGLSSNYIQSFINKEMEYNPTFKEEYKEETTPLPVSLMSRDIKEHYDVQTPFRTVALYNIFLFNKNAEDVFKTFNSIVEKAVKECEETYQNIIKNEGQSRKININIMTFKELKLTAIEEFGEAHVNLIIEQIINQISDERAQAIEIADQLMHMLKNLGPTVITFFAPPYYPAAHSSEDSFIDEIVETVSQKSLEQFDRTSKRQYFFNGISDLSYAKYRQDDDGFESYIEQTPNFNQSYFIPFHDIKEISAPVLNIGPIGKDAHQVTERIHTKSAFEEIPYLIEHVIKKHLLKY